MTLFIILTIALALGSFANVYFFRIPQGLSLWKPGSFCANCGRPVLWKDNIPIFSFLLLKGKCRFCGSDISWRYPAIEFFCLLLFLTLAVKFNSAGILTLVSFTAFSYLLLLAGGIDFVTYLQSGKEYGIIPDHLTWTLAILGLGFSPLNPLFHGQWWLGLIGGATGGFFMLMIRWAGENIYKKEALGWADVKMVIGIGCWLGWKGTFFSLVTASTLGSALITFLIFKKQLHRHSSVPFGTFIGVGTLSVLFYLT